MMQNNLNSIIPNEFTNMLKNELTTEKSTNIFSDEEIKFITNMQTIEKNFEQLIIKNVRDSKRQHDAILYNIHTNSFAKNFESKDYIVYKIQKNLDKLNDFYDIKKKNIHIVKKVERLSMMQRNIFNPLMKHQQMQKNKKLCIFYEN